MKHAAIRFSRILSLLLALTILISSLAVLARPTAAAGIPDDGTPAPAPSFAPADAPVFSNCAGAPQHSCDLQVFLLIDDSSSMLYSDSSQLRYTGVTNVLDILAKEYYLPAADAKDPYIQPPKISVSFIHFNAAVISDTSTQWKTINPESAAAWPAQLKALDADIHIPLDYRQKQNTDFSRAFEVAAQRAGEKPQDPNCPRLVMLFTDGVPNLTGTDLKAHDLNIYMEDLLTLYRKTFARDNDLFYVTEFGADQAFKKTWNKEYKPEWDKFTKDPGPADLPRIQFVDHNILAVRMESIIGKAIGSPAFALKPTTTGSPRKYETVVPELVESLRLTFYYDVNTKTTLTITDKDGKVIQVDGVKATFSGANTPIQVFEIKNPASGKYTITTTAPGGILTQMLVFQKVTPKLVSPVGNMLQFTNQKISILLLGGDGHPLANLPPVAIQARVSTSAGPEDLTFIQASDSLTTSWMPLTSGQASIDACITITDNDKKYILYNGPVGEIPIDTVAVQVGQSETVCTLDDKDILVPLTLVNSRSSQPAVIDASVEWRNIVASNPLSRLALDPVDNQSGKFVLYFRPSSLGEVEFHVQAAAVTNKTVTRLDEVTIHSDGLQAPSQLALKLQNYNTLGDQLSVFFYRWFHPFCAERRPVVLIGRRLFGLFGPTQVQISGRFFDTGTQAAEAGMERFSVQLVSLDGGRSSEPVNQWTSLKTGDGSSVAQIPAPGLGFYQVVVSDRGGSSSCSQLSSLPTAQTVLLIGDFWGYLVILALIILLAVGAFLLRRRFRDRPNVLLVALPILLLVVDIFLVMALVNNAFKCQFNCSYLVDHSILGHYPAENEVSLCRGVAVPLDNYPLIPSNTVGPVHFPGLTIPRVSFLGWTIGPVTLIPEFDIGPLTIPGWTIPARFLPIFPALSFINPPLEVLRRVISWGIVVLFVMSSLVLGNIITRIKGFIEALKDPQKRLVIVTNIIIWLLFFVSFCALFYFSVVQKGQSRSLGSVISIIIPIVIGALIIVLLVLLARRLSQKGQLPSRKAAGIVDHSAHSAPSDAAEPSVPAQPAAPAQPAVPIAAGVVDHSANPAPAAPAAPVVPAVPVGSAAPAVRKTKGIIDDSTDATRDADVIMTAATLGLATMCIVCNEKPMRFDIDPEEKDQAKVEEFYSAVDKMRKAIFNYLDTYHIDHQAIKSGFSPDYEKGGVIMGVYELADQHAPLKLTGPSISPHGMEKYNQIKDESVRQYTGRGAYTGFVDNPKGEPIGPLSTARFWAPSPVPTPPNPHPRWLPPLDRELDLWKKRKRLGSEDDSPENYVPWGLIGGEKAQELPKEPNPCHATNGADQITAEMQAAGMVFNGDVTIEDVAAYTHGMIQAIYKGYHLGPACTPYEVAVGNVTSKLASCIPCTLFMVALGYPPTSIHLGRGESWAPLYEPYNPKGDPAPYEKEVVRDLNNRWYENCLKWLIIGLDILASDGVIDDKHKDSLAKVDQYLRLHTANAFKQRDAADQYRQKHDLKKLMGEISANIAVPEYTVGGVLILDALTIHANEQTRINKTLRGESGPCPPLPHLIGINISR